MDAIVIFGAAVLEDGGPSLALGRRVRYALAAAAESPESPIFCSGARGRHGPSEASVMSTLLRKRRIEPHRIVLDEASHDTLTSVVAASRFIRLRGLSGAIVCTDRFHYPRIRMLFAALGQRARYGPSPDTHDGTPLSYWVWMHLREAAAILYDGVVVLIRRRDLLREISGSES
jgi:vancomycin permeability regulator SanA